MKKTVKILISVIICISVLLSLVSCNLLDAINDFLNRNEDGPGSTWYDVYQFMWVETYDEMLEIVERTRAYGTEIPQIPAFACEEYGLDVKFAIIVENDIFDELEDKYEYFDRKINQFSVFSCVFFKDMTIEEVERYGDLPTYNCAYVPSVYMTGPANRYHIDNPEGASDVNIEKSEINSETTWYYVKYKGKYQFKLINEYKEFEITEEQIEILEKTLTIIE